MKLKDKVVIVAGAGPGIGEATAKIAAEEGADIVVVDINAAEATRIAGDVENTGRQVIAIQADLMEEAECQRVVRTTLDSFGRIDGLANIAGGIGSIWLTKKSDAFLDLTRSEWDQVFNLNLMTCFFMCQAIAPYFMEQNSGKIVNTSSIAAVRYSEEWMAYGCSKAAVLHFSKSLAVTLAPYNINVNTLHPGIVHTPGFHDKTTASRKDRHPERFEGFEGTEGEWLENHVKSMTPLRRSQTPEDMGHMVAFLLSEEAKNITGHAHYVDGGSCM